LNSAFDCAAHGRLRGRGERLRRFVQALLPQACALCNAPAGNALVCDACERDLPHLGAACPVCALPLAQSEVCGACLRAPPPFAATIAPFVYAYPVDRLLWQLKFRGRLCYADWAATALARAVERAHASRDECAILDRIVALPLAPERQRERGFNQAREIATRVARALHLPLAPSLDRVAAGVPQAGLALSERSRNVRGAFAARGNVAGARIALVDDVMTSGATLAAAAGALRRAGAAHVECWIVARTPPPE
jgi:ComF family protein